jgi:hypothetical protein
MAFFGGFVAIALAILAFAGFCSHGMPCCGWLAAAVLGFIGIVNIYAPFRNSED